MMLGCSALQFILLHSIKQTEQNKAEKYGKPPVNKAFLVKQDAYIN